jgi:hypothetical protein
MAENRSSAKDAGTAVPRARAGQPPAQAEPPADQQASGGQAPGRPVDGSDAAAGKPRRAKAAEPAKAAKAGTGTKPAKASKAGTGTKPAKASKAPRAAKVTKSTKPTKATKATKAAPASTAAPASEVTKVAKSTEPSTTAGPVEPVSPVSPAGPAAPGGWAAAAWDALQHADQPPRQLAELAVAELGPRAAAWAGWLRQTYPDAPAYGVVRLATHQATRGGLALALAEAGAPFSAPLLLPATAWVRATVVLRIAAAYGQDPTDRQRADDLIELLGLDPTSTDQDEPGGTGDADLSELGMLRELSGLAGLAGVAGRFGLVRLAGSRFGLHRTAAAVVRALVAASDYHDDLQRLAHRAARHYRLAAPAH